MVSFLIESKISNYQEDRRGKDLKTWRDIPCSITRKLNSLKITFSNLSVYLMQSQSTFQELFHERKRVCLHWRERLTSKTLYKNVKGQEQPSQS